MTYNYMVAGDSDFIAVYRITDDVSDVQFGLAPMYGDKQTVRFTVGLEFVAGDKELERPHWFKMYETYNEALERALKTIDHNYKRLAEEIDDEEAVAMKMLVKRAAFRLEIERVESENENA